MVFLLSLHVQNFSSSSLTHPGSAANTRFMFKIKSGSSMLPETGLRVVPDVAGSAIWL